MNKTKTLMPCKIPAAGLPLLPALLLGAFLSPGAIRAATQDLAANASFTGARTVANADIYTVNAADSGPPLTFLQPSKPDKDTFWLYSMVPDYPSTGNSIYYGKLFPYKNTPDRPAGLAEEITTLAVPVIFAPTGTGAGTFLLTGADVSTFSIASSDAYDGSERKTDVSGVKWAVVQFGEEAAYRSDAPFIHINSAASDITLDLEHVVFVGAKNYGGTNYTGGSTILRTNPATTAAAPRTVTIRGDVAFVNNLGRYNGGVITTQQNLVFEGNVFFEGNLVGINAPDASLSDLGGTLVSQGTAPLYVMSGNDGAAGALRMNVTGGTMHFKKNVLFSNNAGTSDGGAIVLGGGSTTNYVVTFDGTAAFHGNTTGLVGKLGGNLNDSGNGGVLCLITTDATVTNGSLVTFKDTAIFTHNRAANSGGAIANMRSSGTNINGQFVFEKRALFTDNYAGQEGRVAEAMLRISTGNDAILGTIIGYPTYSGTAFTHAGAVYGVGTTGSVIASGGAIAVGGKSEDKSRLVFGDEAQFARNRALGNGGAIIHAGTAGGIDFGSDATFSNNAAGSTQPRSYAGTPDAPTAFIQPQGGAISARVRVTFSDAAVPGSTLSAIGNIAYVSATHATDPIAYSETITGGQGGALYSYGPAGGLYVDQEYLFDGNQSGGHGGAIFAIGTASGPDYAGIIRNYALELTKSGIFTDNLASGNGGAIFATSALVTSGAIFSDNIAGGSGGAIHMDGNASRLTLDAATADITFSGNLAGVTTDASGVDLDLVASETPDGYITIIPGTETKNDINFGLAESQTGTLALNAAAGKTIRLDGGITQTDPAIATALVYVTKTGEGTVAFDGAAADINAVTAVNAGTLLVSGGTYGHDNATAGTKLTLGDGATLAGDGGLMQAATITINAAATLSPANGGELALDSANPVVFVATLPALNTAGSGTLTMSLAGQLAPLTLNNTGDVWLNIGAPFDGNVVNNGVLTIPAGISGALTNNGVLDLGTPANGPYGTLTVTALDGSGTLRMTIDPAGDGDRLVVTGNASGTQTLELTLDGIPGAPLANDALAALVTVQGDNTADFNGSFTHGGITYRIQINSAGQIVLDQPTPEITSADSAIGTVAVPFSYTITADGAPNAFAVDGALPPGLTFAPATARISGTPIAPGTWTVTLRASNANGEHTAPLTITIDPSDHIVTPVITGTTIIGAVNRELSYQVLATNDPTSYAATGLPGDLDIDATSGLISGMVLDAPATYPVEIVAANIYGTGTGNLLFNIGEVPEIIDSGSFVSGTSGIAMTYQINATGCVDSYDADGLPGGLTLNNATGLISGAPSVYGTFDATLLATNIYGTGSAIEQFVIAIPVGAIPEITSTLSVSGSVGSPLSYRIEATYEPYRFGADPLPDGLAVDADTGMVSGTPIWSGTYETVVTATNIYGFGSATVNFAIAGSGSFAPGVLPEIITQPSDATVILGGTAAFSVVATGTELSHQWFKDSGSLTGQTAALLTLPGVTDADAGDYYVTVSNTHLLVTSATATLTVITPPAIEWLDGLGSRTVPEGDPTTFTVNVTAGTPLLTYKWTKNNALIDTATGPVHAIPATEYHADNNATFKIEVTNSGGTMSLTAALTIIPTPTTLARIFKTQAESEGPADIAVNGTVDLSLVGGVTIASGKSVTGEDTNATLTGSLLIPEGANDIGIRGVNFTGGTFDITGATGIEISHATFTDTPVTITGGADNIAFSWSRFAATPGGSGSAMRIDGAGAATGIFLHHNLWDESLRADMPAATDARVYMLNNYLVSTGGNATATIAGPDAQILSIANVYSGVNNPLDKQPGGLLRTPGDALANFVHDTTGTNAPGEDKVFVPGYSHIIQPAGIDVPGVDVLVQLIAAHAGNTAGRDSVTPFETAADVRITAVSSDRDAIIADAGMIVPPVTNFTLTATATLPDDSPLQWYRDNFIIAGATTATHTVTDALDAPHSGAYAVALTTPSGDIVASGAFTVTVGELAPPVITGHPTSLVVPLGGRATFAIAATGGHLSYQWQKDGADIPGANGQGYGVATYTIPSVEPGHAGSYTIRVANLIGSETSNAATLTIGGTAAGGGSSDGGGGGGGGAPSLWFLAALAALLAARAGASRITMNKIKNTVVRKILAGCFPILPALVLAASAILSPVQIRAQIPPGNWTGVWSGTYSHLGTVNVANDSVFLVDATPGSTMSSFLVSKPDRDLWVWSLVPNFPSASDYHLLYKAYFYQYSPDRPSWLAAQIDTWATPVQVMPAESSGTSAVPPPTFRLNGAANTLSILSSDAFDADGKRRVDTGNINWAVLDFNGIYSQSTLDNSAFIRVNSGVTANEVTLDLDHVIFMNAQRTKADSDYTNGAAVILNSLSSATKTLIIKGDVGFVNNKANVGSVITTTSNLTFTGNVFFDGNISGFMLPNKDQLRDENGLLAQQVNPETGEPVEFPDVLMSKTDATGGAMRINRTDSLTTFKQTAIFTNNISGGEGGAIMGGGSSTNGFKLLFEGNTAFFGNIAGFIGKSGSDGGQGPGRGGAIYFLVTTSANKQWATFKREAIFVSNRSNEGGGAIGNLSASGNVDFIFEGRTLFSDNMTGREQRWEKIELVLTESLVDLIGEEAMLPTYLGNGGAIATTGNVEDSGLFFHGETEFLRNRATGSGGALSHTGSYGRITFTGDSTFTDNVAGSTLYRAWSGTNSLSPTVTRSNGGAINSSIRIYFDGRNGNQVLFDGNMARFSSTGAAPEDPIITGGNGGAINSTGVSGGLYIDQQYTFIRNQAGGNGGAIYATGATKDYTDWMGIHRNYAVELTKGGRFIENLASGGIWSEDTATIGRGGAIYANSALITSGASFENNAAGSYGGAIYMAGDGTLLTLDASTDDITFTGNRQLVTTDESGFDPELVASQTSTGGRITVTPGSGMENDIAFALARGTGSLELNAGAGHKIYFDGGIIMTSSTDSDTGEAGTGLLTVTKTGDGIVEFDNANASIAAVTDIQSGILRLRNSNYGAGINGASVPDTSFTLGSAATLEASGLITAETIAINTGATLRVLDGGNLRFDSAGPVNYGSTINLAGNGRIYTGATGPLTAKTITLGDDNHTTGQNLRLYADTDTALDVRLDASQLSFGLYTGNADHLYLGALDLGAATNRINLTSLASGDFTLITATSPIANAATQFEIYYKGALLPSNARLAASVTVNGSLVNLSYNAQNTTVTWTGASGDNWNSNDAKWTGVGVTDNKYLYGDIIVFDAARSGSVTINAEVVASGMTVSGNYTLTGAAGIELSDLLWSGPANSSANGILVKNGAADTTLTLANATGPGACNQFAGIDIKSGIVSVGNAAQLGTALANITFSGDADANATLRITGTLALSGKTGGQRLDIAAGNTGNIAVDSTGLFVVAGNNAAGQNGGVLHIGDNAILNLAAAGDVMFTGNTASEGGGAYLETGATFNLDVSAGKTVLFGNPDRKATALDTRLLQADTLASADDTAVINKNGAGLLMLNGDNTAYKGAFNINSGTVWMNADAILGGNVTLAGPGVTLAASTFTGNVYAGAGSIVQVGDRDSNIPQVMRVAGTLTLDNAILMLDGFQGSLLYRDLYTDAVETGALVMTGTNYFDINFAKLSSGIYTILTATTGSFLDDAGLPTIPIEIVAAQTWSNTLAVHSANSETGEEQIYHIVTDGTLFQYKLDDLILTSGGQSIEGKRFNAGIFLSDELLTSGVSIHDQDGTAITGTVTVSGSYLGSDGEWAGIDTEIVTHTGADPVISGSSLLLDVAVQNLRLRWSGSTSAVWNATDADWADPVTDADNCFVAGDGVHFDGISDAGYETNREIAVTAGGVLVGEMVVSGDADYTFTGGRIEGASFRSNLENPALATGALEMNGTGVLTLANAGNVFEYGIRINSGTVVGNAASLNENKITLADATTLIYVQVVNDTLVGDISGPGTVIKTGTGRLTFSTNGSTAMSVANLVVGQGMLVVPGSMLSVTEQVVIAPEGALAVSGTLQTAVLVNAGALRVTPSATNAVTHLPLMGDYVGVPGSKLVLNVLNDHIGADSLLVSGHAAGETEIVLVPSGTYPNINKPAAKRDIILLHADGVNQVQVTNPLGVSFRLSGTGEDDEGISCTLLQGRDGTVYLRNDDADLAAINLPAIAAAPIVADQLGQEMINALAGRINARHDTLSKGWTAWTNYSHSLGRIRRGGYGNTDLTTNTAQLGAEYVFSDAADPGPGQFSAGLAYAYASAKATRENQSTIEASSHALNAYASWQKGPLYASAIASYSPSSTYKARLSALDTLDSDGDVKADRLAASLEIGGILTVPKGGQFEPYIQAIWQQNTFGDISRPDRDYSFNDPDSPTGRRYAFDDFSKIRAFAGARWSARYDAGAKTILKPWAGYATGRALKNSYRIRVDGKFIEQDMDGTINRFSGGVSALMAFGLEAYATCHWTTGAGANALSLLGGVNYRW